MNCRSFDMYHSCADRRLGRGQVESADQIHQESVRLQVDEHHRCRVLHSNCPNQQQENQSETKNM